MMKRSVILRLVVRTALVLAFAAGPPCAFAATPTAIILQNLDGRATPAFDDAGHRDSVYFFIIHDCPICNAYAPEINRICQDYRTSDIAFHIVYVEADLSRASAKKHAVQHQFTCSALLDPRHALVKYAGADVAPEAVILTADRHVAYRGRIDNRMLGWGSMHMANVFDLREALTAIQGGRPVARPWKAAIGCAISTP